MNNSKDIGQNGEKITLNYLLNKNYFLLEKNYHSRYGEIDIIVENETELTYNLVNRKIQVPNTSSKELPFILKIINIILLTLTHV